MTTDDKRHLKSTVQDVKDIVEQVFPTQGATPEMVTNILREATIIYLTEKRDETQGG